MRQLQDVCCSQYDVGRVDNVEECCVRGRIGSVLYSDSVTGELLSEVVVVDVH